MTPRPYVRGQAVVLAVGLAALCLIGAWALALGLSALVAVVATLARVDYRRTLAGAQVKPPEHRSELDRLVVGLSVGVVLCGTLLGAAAATIGDPLLALHDPSARAIPKALA